MHGFQDIDFNCTLITFAAATTFSIGPSAIRLNRTVRPDPRRLRTVGGNHQDSGVGDHPSQLALRRKSESRTASGWPYNQKQVRRRKHGSNRDVRTRAGRTGADRHLQKQRESP